MKTLILIILIFLQFAFSVDKNQFDIKYQKNQLSKSQSAIELENDFYSVTLLNDGFFTVGTANGRSDSFADDDCQLTYGHPYAKTSFPVFSIDGEWNLFSSLSNIKTGYAADTVKIEGELENKIHAEFKVYFDNENQTILELSLKNIDTVNHQVAGGLFIDPALGKNGDGTIFIENTPVEESLIFETEKQLELWEKSAGARGIGCQLHFSPSAEKIFAVNWQAEWNVYDPNDSNVIPGQKLFDLLLKIYWGETELSTNQKITNKTVISLNQPDFSNPYFLRWDLPQFFSIDEGRLFPRDWDTFIEILKIESFTSGTLTFELKENSYIQSAQGNIVQNITLPSTIIKQAVKSKLVYEDIITEVSLVLKNTQNQIIEEYNQTVFIPATPLSYEGLSIYSDSVIIENYPQVDLIFGIEDEETGQKILDLSYENIFLYENDQRINDFDIGKYEIEGSNLADVVFVLDVSGSMGDEIDQIETYLGEFADSLAAKGYDYRIGLVTFSTTIDQIWDFTDDVEHVKANLAGISLWGGVEDSPLALYEASNLSFREGSRRTIIWVTDEPYPEHSYTKEQVVDRMLLMDIRVHGVGLLNLQTEWFNPIIIPTGGNFYDITGNFRDILIDVTNFSAQDIYKLSYSSQSSIESNTLTLEIHYEGLGVIKDYSYNKPGQNITPSVLSCYPNPFNPVIYFKVDASTITRGKINIYNALGQRVKSFPVNQGIQNIIEWNAQNDNGRQLGSGLYFVELKLVNSKNIRKSYTQKILYVK